MPGFVLCGRRWSIGSDDIFIPAIILFAFHLIEYLYSTFILFLDKMSLFNYFMKIHYVDKHFIIYSTRTQMDLFNHHVRVSDCLFDHFVNDAHTWVDGSCSLLSWLCARHQATQVSPTYYLFPSRYARLSQYFHNNFLLNYYFCVIKVIFLLEIVFTIWGSIILLNLKEFCTKNWHNLFMKQTITGMTYNINIFNWYIHVSI
jgi:hypothetical protein